MSPLVKAALIGVVLSVILSGMGVGLAAFVGSDPLKTAILVHVSAITVLVSALYIRHASDEQ